MNLPSLTLSLTLLASTSVMAQERPPTLGEARHPDTAKLHAADQAAKTAKAADKPAPRGRVLPQPDNPLDPNRPPKSDREPAKIRPAEQAATPIENARKVPVRPAASSTKGDDRRKARDAAEPAKIRPAEQAVTPAENTDKVKDKNAALDAGRAGQQASRRSVPLVVGSMPAARAPASYGPTLTPQPGALANPPVNLATNPPTNLPTSSLTPARPAVVNGCDGGGCTDTNGVRYNGGVGKAMVGPQGQLCHRNGLTVYC